MIVIDGWTELPPHCDGCPLEFTSYNNNDYCCITGDHIIDEEKRLKSCPLKEFSLTPRIIWEHFY